MIADWRAALLAVVLFIASIIFLLKAILANNWHDEDNFYPLSIFSFFFAIFFFFVGFSK